MSVNQQNYLPDISEDDILDLLGFFPTYVLLGIRARNTIGVIVGWPPCHMCITKTRVKSWWAQFFIFLGFFYVLFFFTRGKHPSKVICWHARKPIRYEVLLVTVNVYREILSIQQYCHFHIAVFIFDQYLSRTHLFIIHFLCVGSTLGFVSQILTKIPIKYCHVKVALSLDCISKLQFTCHEAKLLYKEDSSHSAHKV